MTDSTGLFDDDDDEPLFDENRSLNRKGESLIERRAVAEGWLVAIDERAKEMVEKQIDDAINGESARDRRGAFSAVMKAKHNHEQANKDDTPPISIHGSQVRITLPDNGRRRVE